MLTVLALIVTLVSATTDNPGMLDPTDLREVDSYLLEYLSDGRVTPQYARKRLIEDLEEYSRGYVQQRLKRLEEHSHVQNLLDTGLYELVDDPREGGDAQRD